MNRRVLGLVVLGITGCSGAGSAPSLTSLSCDPSTLTVAQTNTVTCDVAFEDTDADVDAVQIHFVDSANMIANSESPFAGAEGLHSGIGRVTLLLRPSAVGNATLDVQVRDTQGNLSPPTTAPFTCVSP